MLFFILPKLLYGQRTTPIQTLDDLFGFAKSI